MIGYAAKEVFERRELDLWQRATELVALVPYAIDGEPVRCHELARAVGKALGLKFQDGRYGLVSHTWLWLSPLPDEGYGLLRKEIPNILDVYVPGAHPQVQLIHSGSAGLPLNYSLPFRNELLIRGATLEKILGFIEILQPVKDASVRKEEVLPII